MQCQFERKYKRSYETATEKELNQFIFTSVSTNYKHHFVCAMGTNTAV